MNDVNHTTTPFDAILMTATTSSSTLSEEAMNDKIASLKMAIRQAMHDAIETSSSSSHEVLLAADGNDKNNNSFALGMTLFGQDPAWIEQETCKQLQKLESELVSLLSEGTTDAPETLREEAQELRHQVSFLSLCSQVRAALNDDSQSPHHVVKALAYLEQAQAMLQDRRDSQSRNKNDDSTRHGKHNRQLVQALTTSCRRAQWQLVSQARHVVETNVTITSTSISIKTKQWTVALETLKLFSKELDPCLWKLMANIVQDVILPHLTKIAGPVTLQDTSTRMMHSLEWEMTTTADTTTSHLETLWNHRLSFLQTVLTFLYKHILLEQNASLVGSRLFGASNTTKGVWKAMHSLNLSSQSLHSFPATHIPLVQLLQDSCLTTLTHEQLQTLLQPFIDAMLELNFLTPDTNPLTDLLQPHRPVKQRQTQILTQARQILLHNDAHTTVSVGQDAKDEAFAVFTIPPCRVSMTATQLMQLCRDTLDEAVVASPQPIAAVLYQTARHVLDLYRAMTTPKDPRTAAIVHNDAVYLSHHCLTLGLEYQSRFADKNMTCIFVDMVPLFRQMAQDALGNELERQEQSLREMVAPNISLWGASLASNQVMAEWIDAKTALEQAMRHLEQELLHVWRPLLAKSVLDRSLQYLLDSLLGLYQEQLLHHTTAISETASFWVASLFATVVQQYHTPESFLALYKFLTMSSLADVEVALSQGAFVSLTAHQLTHLIRATFNDSDKRRKLLKALQKE
jgi:centromere/kinetochore protein ZW10